MNKINWSSKLSSRKFWALIAALAVALLSAIGADAGTVEKTVGVIGAVGSCAVYMIAEGVADAGRKNTEATKGDN